MNNRRKKHINSEIKLGVIFPIIGFQVIFYTFLAFIIVYNVTNYKNTDITSVKDLEKMLTAENQVVETFNQYSKSVHDFNMQIVSQKLNNIHKNNQKTIHAHILSLKQHDNKDFNWIILLIGIGVIQLFFMFYYVLRKTYRVTGPEYIMMQHLQDIIDGKTPNFRGLRKDDELHDLYEKMRLVYEKKIKD